ncbi:MAG: tRNA dihydrouridine synthase DusB [Deferrisomatales bacterium]
MNTAEPLFLMAPMAGVTDPAFRARLRRWGCRALATEMVSAAALARGNRRTLSYLQAPDRGRDLTLQVFGADPDELARAGERVYEAGYPWLDFNMGCPVKKVVRSGAGAALLADPERARRCLVALRRAFPGRLSVKIRSGWDAGSVNCLEVGKMAEDCGVDRVTLHPRTRAQGYAGKADWSWVARLVREVSVPVAGNGDVASGPEAAARLRRTGCAAVMIGRGALGAPWVFRDAEAAWRGAPAPPPPEAPRIGLDLLRQIDDLARWKGERAAVVEMRKFLAWGAKGMGGATEFRREIQQCDSRDRLEAAVRRFFRVGEEERTERGVRGRRATGGPVATVE